MKTTVSRDPTRIYDVTRRMTVVLFLVTLWELVGNQWCMRTKSSKPNIGQSFREHSSASAIHTMMAVLFFSGNFLVQCWRCSPSLEIEEVPRKNKGHLCPCLFTAFHSRNPHGLLSLFVILSYYWFSCVLFSLLVFLSSSRLFFTPSFASCYRWTGKVT